MPYTNAALNILVVEDNEGDFIIIEELLYLVSSKFNITRAKTLSETIFSLNNNSFDVVLLDLSLPDAKGEALVNKVVDAANNIPVIVLTGFGDRRFGIISLSLGVSDYLLKDELSKVQLEKCITYSIERKKISNELVKSEEKYRELFHLSPIPMWVCDINNNEFLSVNDAAINNYGYTLEEFLSMGIKDILYSSNEDLHENKSKLCGGRSKHVKKNGKIIDVEIKANTFWLNNKEVCLVLATDITESLLYINKVEEQNKKLRDIAWMQSHVVRAPLARILGLADLLLLDVVSNEDNNAVLLLIQNSAKELDKVIREISSNTEKVDL